MRRRCPGKYGRGLAALLALALCACATTGRPDASEQAAVAAGSEAVVLLRLDLRVNGRPYPAFPSGWMADAVAVGLGDFESAGEPRQVANRHLSEASRAQGWQFFVLRPGTYYFKLMSPRIDGDPVWRIDVPTGAPLVYAGTLALQALGGPSLLSREVMLIDQIPADAAVVVDESAAARALAAAFFAHPLRAAPMQRWQPGTPIILRAPLPAP